MEHEFGQINSSPLPKGTRYLSLNYIPTVIHDNDPAVDAMIDLKLFHAATISPNTCAHEALEKMKRMDVKALFVGSNDDVVQGIVSSQDLQGAKTTQIAAQQGVKASDVSVQMLMTPQDKLQTICFQELSNMQVGHIIRKMHDDNLQHLLVLEEYLGEQIVRGVFSTRRISIMLGESLHGDYSSSSVAEFNARLKD